MNYELKMEFLVRLVIEMAGYIEHLLTNEVTDPSEEMKADLEHYRQWRSLMWQEIGRKERSSGL